MNGKEKGWEGEGMNAIVRNKEFGRKGKRERKMKNGGGRGGEGNQRGAMARDNPLFVLIICNNEIIIIRDIDELRVTGDIIINRQK